VKVCSLYGVGYYYIPGTDTCIKIGGYVRYEAYHNEVSGHYADRNPAGNFTRNSQTFGQQARFRMTADVRTQTEYGTLRSYFSFGFNFLNGATDADNGGIQSAIALERAFIQFAGFTFGRSDTFFGFYNGAAYGLVPMGLDGSSGPSGHNVAAYTWQFGNGLSATISVEDSNARSKGVTDLSATPTALAGASDMSGQKLPDIVGNIRVDQAWGSAQIMGGLHQVGARYYNGPTPGFGGCVANTTTCDHPSDEWGWGVGAGLTLKMPWDARDTLSGVIAYSKGAVGFVAYGNSATNFIHKQGIAVGMDPDAVFVTGSGLELTEAWGGTVAFEHYWTPSLRSSVVGSYLNVSYSDQAKAMIAATGGGACAASGFAAVTNCNPDYSIWRVASRTMWNPVANLDVGVEVAYTHLDSAFAGLGARATGANGLAPGVYNIEDQGYWSAAFRVQRNFWP